MTTVLTDNAHYSAIASAIRGKNGTQATYAPSEMAAAIAAIPTGGGASLGSKSIDTNGTYSASDDGFDGYDVVNVNVSGGSGDISGLIERTATSIYDGSASFVASFAMYSFSTLREVSFPNCTTVGSSAFYDCTLLSNVSIPKCTTIGSYAFYRCSSLPEITVPSCTNIGVAAFQSCGRLSRVNAPLVTYIGSWAFSRCYSLQEVDMRGCQIIEVSAFASCSRLKSAPFPNLRSIWSWAFYGCYRMSYAVMGSATLIGSNAFGQCSVLESLYLTGASRVPELSYNAFYGTPIGGYSTTLGRYGSIFVPESLYSNFIAASSYWSSVSSRIVSMTAEEIAALDF